MPWSASDAKGKTKKATSKASKKQWAEVANSVRKSTGDDVRAIKEADAVVARRKKKK